MGNLLIFELAQNELELRHLLLIHLADNDCGIDRGQRGAHVVGEFDRAGTINESEALAHESRGGDRELYAHHMMARLLAAVADRRAGLYRALTLDRTGTGEDRLHQRGLATLERAHQRDAPGTRCSCAVLCHFPPPFRFRDAALCETRAEQLSFQPYDRLASDSYRWRHPTAAVNA